MKTHTMQCLVAIIYFFTLSIVIVLSDNLHATTLKPKDIRNFLGTRTPYRFKNNKNDTRISFPSCKETKIWMILRHGTRLPSAKDILGMNTKLKDLKFEILMKNNQGKGALKEDNLNLFKKWSTDIEIEQEKYLTLEGQYEMIQLAERMQKRFPNAIKNKYNSKHFKFKYTATQRAQQSARYFTVGLFDKNNSQSVVFEPALKVDTTLRFYKHCDKWLKQVKRNPNTYKEQILYGNSNEMNATLQSISERFGLDRVLRLDTVSLIYKICGYETSWHKYYSSPWCLGFDDVSIKILEYYHDLKHYWLDGYGFDLTYRQACMLLKNMFQSFSKKGPNATFLFAHSGTLLKLLTHLKLYKPDSHLRGDTIVEDRAWRVSDIDCFASNLAFVLYKCKDGDKVLSLHQERIIKLPMCNEELCPLEHLKEYFFDSIHNCDHSDMCRLD
ncbi:multiple inositol polyphosphate phosphatase 1-like [Vanessa cardui]|uniref:multiple inositol polyphosphate phosphatase 1-like n=1 Tax=Vanessa cardui TaxID=171605 RepID=UPI001F13B80D|nr:multiple inositol polyphosphate phosphatase 1-like [Vanessa cardui]